jgi:hypothetical protein
MAENNQRRISRSSSWGAWQPKRHIFFYILHIFNVSEVGWQSSVDSDC